MELSHVYPYLIPGLINPEWEDIAIPVGHGVYATLFEDHESEAGIVHTTVNPEALQAAGLTAEEAHRTALANLARFAHGEGPRGLSMKMIGSPGEPVNFVLISDHARAAACLRLPDLYGWTSQLLETAEICACAPQREVLIVLPKRDRDYRRMIVEKVRSLEAGARRPISFELFELGREGVRPFYES